MSKIIDWVLILGGSSGFGLATAKYFAVKGYNIIIVHRDKRSEIEKINKEFETIKENNVKLICVNTNAVTQEGRIKTIETIKKEFSENDKIKLLLHSIADGNTQQINAKSIEELENSFLYSINSMGTSFVLWARALVDYGLFSDNAKIIGLTSEGSYRYISGYSQVGAAKSVLENICRSLAVEYARYNITTNIINPGITDTKALRALPKCDYLIKTAKSKNPFKRLTIPEDVAKVIWLLAQDEANWINGEIIRVDGGEQIVY